MGGRHVNHDALHAAQASSTGKIKKPEALQIIASFQARVSSLTPRLCKPTSAWSNTILSPRLLGPSHIS